MCSALQKYSCNHESAVLRKWNHSNNSIRIVQRLSKAWETEIWMIRTGRPDESTSEWNRKRRKTSRPPAHKITEFKEVSHAYRDRWQNNYHSKVKSMLTYAYTCAYERICESIPACVHVYAHALLHIYTHAGAHVYCRKHTNSRNVCIYILVNVYACRSM